MDEQIDRRHCCHHVKMEGHDAIAFTCTAAEVRNIVTEEVPF